MSTFENLPRSEQFCTPWPSSTFSPWPSDRPRIVLVEITARVSTIVSTIVTMKAVLPPFVIQNKLIELYHTMLCAAIPRESNNTNENKTLRILNQAYADLMIQRSTLKPLGTYKYAQQLHNRIFCVEHTGSFSVYTLEGCTKYISRWGFPLWQTMTSEWQHRVHTVINIQKYDVHITIYSSGTIPLQYDQTKHFKRYEKIVRHYSLEQLKHHFSF